MPSNLSESWQYAHVGEYLRVRHAALTLLSQGRTVRLSWAGPEYDAANWQQQCIDALDRRITLKAGPEPRWRKLSEEWQTDIRRDARTFADKLQRRIRCYRFNTCEMNARFGYLLASHDD